MNIRSVLATLIFATAAFVHSEDARAIVIQTFCADNSLLIPRFSGYPLYNVKCDVWFYQIEGSLYADYMQTAAWVTNLEMNVRGRTSWRTTYFSIDDNPATWWIACAAPEGSRRLNVEAITYYWYVMFVFVEGYPNGGFWAVVDIPQAWAVNSGFAYVFYVNPCPTQWPNYPYYPRA